MCEPQRCSQRCARTRHKTEEQRTNTQKDAHTTQDKRAKGPNRDTDTDKRKRGARARASTARMRGQLHTDTDRHRQRDRKSDTKTDTKQKRRARQDRHKENAHDTHTRKARKTHTREARKSSARQEKRERARTGRRRGCGRSQPPRGASQCPTPQSAREAAFSRPAARIRSTCEGGYGACQRWVEKSTRVGREQCAGEESVEERREEIVCGVRGEEGDREEEGKWREGDTRHTDRDRDRETELIRGSAAR
eukprot:1959137-Rhodomonas_salina.1